MPKRVGYLYEKILDCAFIRKTILEAAKKRRNRSDIRPVIDNLDEYVRKTYNIISSGCFDPSTPKAKRIYDESSQKWREIKYSPFWPDGVMQWILVVAMKPVLMRGMCHWSCASIPGRGGKRVYSHIKKIMHNDRKGTKYAAELDIKQYYPSLKIGKVITALERKIKDKGFLRLVYDTVSAGGDTLAIGFYINQWLANFYLEPLDAFIQSIPGVKYMTRYMDNITLFGPNKKKLNRAVLEIRNFLRESLGLRLKGNWQVYPTKRRRVSAVGYRFSSKCTILRKRNFLRLTRQCRRVKKKLDRRMQIQAGQASALLSRIGQLKHCDSYRVRKKYVDPIKIKTLKEVVRLESKRRLAAQRRIHH